MMCLGYGFLMSLEGADFHKTTLFTGVCVQTGLSFMMDGNIKNMKIVDADTRATGILHAFDENIKRSNNMVLIGRLYDKLHDLAYDEDLDEELHQKLLTHGQRIVIWYQNNKVEIEQNIKAKNMKNRNIIIREELKWD